MGESGHKRKSDGGGSAGGRNKKAYYPSSSNRDKTIPPHTRGIMVSAVAGKEQQAARDAIALFTEAYEALKQQPEGGGGTEGEAAAEAPAAPADPAAALASEVAALKDKDAQLFYWHPSGLNSVVYVEYRGADGDPSPSQLVMHVCEQAKATKQSRSRFACRFHPVEHQCFASLEKIEELAAKVVEQHFPTGEGVEPIAFAVQYEHRAAPNLDRMKVIDAFAKRIGPPHKVNLSAPQATVLVNLVKSTCAVAVVPRFKELMKFNLRSLTGDNDEERNANKARQAAVATTKPEATATTGEGQAVELQAEQKTEGQQATDSVAAEKAAAEAVAAAEEEGL